MPVYDTNKICSATCSDSSNVWTGIECKDKCDDNKPYKIVGTQKICIEEGDCKTNTFKVVDDLK